VAWHSTVTREILTSGHRSDDSEYEGETSVIPGISEEEVDQNTQKIMEASNLKMFQGIDIDEEVNKQLPAQPQTEGIVLHEPGLDSEEIEASDKEEHEYEYDPSVPTSTFAPFPSEIPETEEEFIAMMTESQEQQSKKTQQDDKSVPLIQSRTSEDLDTGEMASIHSRSPIAENLTYDDSEEDEEYVPKQSHFRSDIITSPVKARHDESKDIEGHRSPTVESSSIPGDSPIAISSGESNPSSSIASSEDTEIATKPIEQTIQSPGSEIPHISHQDADDKNEDDYILQASHLQPDPISEPPIQNLTINENSGPSPTANTDSISVTESRKNDLEIKPPSASTYLEPPQSSPETYELSDTDTLHITKESSGNSSIREISEDEAGIPHSESVKFDGQLQEHAYLSDLIHTPVVEDQEQFQHESSEEEHSADEPGNRLGVSSDLNRNSQFYSSVSDYFDDYAEDENHESLNMTRTRSSGSLSTGSFSLNSERRSSRMSDRTESLTNQSLSQFSEVQSNAESTKEVEPGEPQLNSALSINMGHWRPNTESFRDQFINGSAVVPPLPKLDNYTRNSNGEIVEDMHSIPESSNEQPVSTGDEKDTSMISSFDTSTEIEQTQSKALYDDVYKTDSDSAIPVHIPLATLNSRDDSIKSNHFQVHSSSSTTSLSIPRQSQELPKRKPSTYHFQNIVTLKDSQQRIKKYKEAREEEANIQTGLEIWISQALDGSEVVHYKGNKNTHVKQAYAEASNFSKRYTNMNMGSLLQKGRVLQGTSSQTAHSFAKGAKGIFSRGKKIIKNEK
jgi:hypothetical protein